MSKDERNKSIRLEVVGHGIACDAILLISVGSNTMYIRCTKTDVHDLHSVILNNVVLTWEVI